MEYRVVVNECGDTLWYKPGTGLYHRENGPAIEYSNGSKFWYRDGICHREDGPAMEWANGTKHWCRDGRFHREDGPAIEYSNGYKAWYLDGVKMTEEFFLVKTQPAKELTVAELENLLGYKIKIIK